jgi:hypothetical protein
MNDRERRLRTALEEARAGDERAAEERAWRVVLAADPAGAPGSRRPRRARRRATQVAVVVALVALLVSPAGASVRHWVADRIEPGAPHAQPVLSSLPGHGSLLVQSPQGPWVVHPDGSKRLLGDWTEASWSPHGLFAVVTRGHELAAVEPDGKVRWTITRPGRPRLARWNGPDGFRIAYLEGSALRVVDGDGSGDHRVATGVAVVAPAWRFGRGHELAYVSERGARVMTAMADSPSVRGRPAGGPPPVRHALAAGSRVLALQWSGDRLLVTRRDRVQLFGPRRRPLWTWTPPAGSRISAASIAPDGARLAIVTADGATSRVTLAARGRGSRVLFAGPGRLAAPRWSPEGRWLLVPWVSADQWLFLEPASGTAKLHAVAHLDRQFSPGDRSAASFPSVVGWCCTVH